MFIISYLRLLSYVSLVNHLILCGEPYALDVQSTVLKAVLTHYISVKVAVPLYKYSDTSTNRAIKNVRKHAKVKLYSQGYQIIITDKLMF